MRDENFSNEVRQRWARRNDKNRFWVGAFFLVIGGLLFAKTTGVQFPHWFFTWPMLLVAIGLFIGLKHGFRGPGWFIMMLIGGVFLYDRVNEDIYLKPYLLPAIFLSIGLIVLFKPRRKHRRFKEEFSGGLAGSTQPTSAIPDETCGPQWQTSVDDNDVIDITAVFGGIKKKILSKNFRGGDIVAIMGGCEIDLTQADFKQKVVVDSFCMFGGTKLLVPPGWNVQSEVVAIFGGVDDKRPPATDYDPSKVIFLEGTCIFGGIEIKSF